AAGGTLTFMVGGERHAFDAAQTVLEAMGKAVIHAGDAGNGQAAKICNNMLLAIQMIGTCEAFTMAQKLGLDPRNFYDIASVSSGQCWSMTSYCPVPGVGPESPSDKEYQGGFASALMVKDLRLAMEAARGADASTPLGNHARELYEGFAAEHGDLDFSGIIRTL
ncbi:MAG: NAD-binding protein, partial [Erythrobacter sp.]